MSLHLTRIVCVVASLLAIPTGETHAQLLNPAAACYCIRPVTQTYYQSIPVTEYRQVTTTVRRPVIETSYVDQQVTEYRPLTEVKTVQVPTVNYQTVTSYQTVQQPTGQWITRFHQVPRITPCQYDNRPDLFGLINRTAFSIRQAFTPSVIASREYVGSMITQQIPVTRTVAAQGTRQVSYNVTRMVAQTSIRKVAVNSVRYVEQQVAMLQPVTVMRNIPVGTRTVFSYSPYAAPATQTVLLPVAPNASRSAAKPRRFDAGEANPTRSAAGDNRTSLNRSATSRPLPAAAVLTGWRTRTTTAATTAATTVSGPRLVVIR
jgi:hypothetical protein